jgi:hypothetical protein
MGMEKVKKHWRYLIARWSAYPVVWCLAGEGTCLTIFRKPRNRMPRSKNTD